MKKTSFPLLAGLLGAAAGFLNGMFGTGGGMMTVPMLQHLKLPTRKAHATSIAIILPLSVVTTLLLFWQGVQVPWLLPLIWLPCGLLGAKAGSLLLYKMNTRLLRRGFGVFLLYSGIRMLFFS